MKKKKKKPNNLYKPNSATGNQIESVMPCPERVYGTSNRRGTPKRHCSIFGRNCEMIIYGTRNVVIEQG